MSSNDLFSQSAPVTAASEAETANKKRKLELPQVEFSAGDTTVKEETPMGECLCWMYSTETACGWVIGR